MEMKLSFSALKKMSYSLIFINEIKPTLIGILFWGKYRQNYSFAGASEILTKTLEFKSSFTAFKVTIEGVNL